MTDETKRKLSDAQKGKKSYWYGKKQSEETIDKRRKYMLGEKNHFYNKKHSNKSKKKMSSSAKNRKNISRKVKYVLISSNNEKFIIVGGFKQFCRKYNLSEKMLRNNINKGDIVLKDNTKRKTDKSKNTIGWSITKGE